MKERERERGEEESDKYAAESSKELCKRGRKRWTAEFLAELKDR